jgi:hypothetical protein
LALLLLLLLLGCERLVVLQDRSQRVENPLEGRLSPLLQCKRNERIASRCGRNGRSSKFNLEPHTLDDRTRTLWISDFVQTAFQPSHPINIHQCHSDTHILQSLSCPFSRVGNVIMREHSTRRWLEREEIVKPRSFWRRRTARCGGGRDGGEVGNGRCGSGKIRRIWDRIDGDLLSLFQHAECVLSISSVSVR